MINKNNEKNYHTRKATSTSFVTSVWHKKSPNLLYEKLGKRSGNLTRRYMEENHERILKLLEAWMNNKRIPREDQIKYYHKLIHLLENKKDELKTRLCTIGVGAGGIGFGCGLMFPDDTDFNFYLGILFVLFGLIFTVPGKIEKPDFKEYQDIEEERKLIKKWWREKKE